ncbi:VOC family protein [Haloprofundus salilacus]|uniref:VOC family protein n=1 Tax=Haloprofundus salilacus TaxID=2876190 RepID=UPI001CCA8286|nr:VOC family protein [Haloprofundus salilacus]
MPHLGHIHLKVRELDRAIDFYSSVLGLDVTERHANYAFLSFGSHHHDLALQALGDDAPDPGPGVGLYHSAWEVETPAKLRGTYEALDERGVSVAPVDHGISKALYFDDPDGNGVEVYLDTREANDQLEWDGRNRRFDPTAIGGSSP